MVKRAKKKQEEIHSIPLKRFIEYMPILSQMTSLTKVYRSAEGEVFIIKEFTELIRGQQGLIRDRM